MKRAIVAGVALLLAGVSFGADPLPTTIAGIRTNVGNRQVPFDTTAPVIDGTVNVDEYTYSSPLIQSNGLTTTSPDGSDGYGDVTGTPPTDAADLSMRIHMSHDADNLYVAVEVTDDILKNNRAQPGQFWNDDTIEMYLDADNTGNGRFANTAGMDRPGTAGGRLNFASGVEGDENTADVLLTGATAANAYGPSITLPDSTGGRSAGTSLGNSVVDSSPGVPNPATDMDFIMHRLDPGANGNRVLELRIPKTGLSYTRTTHPAAGAPVNCGVFTNDIIGMRIALCDNDDDTPGVEHSMQDENAAENLDGTDSLRNALDVVLTPTIGENIIANSYDTVEGGIKDGPAWNFEACLSRYQLLPAASSVEDWQNQ